MIVKQDNREYEIQENDLDILVKANPLIIRYKVLEEEHLFGIDFSILDEYEKRINNYETVIEQLSGRELSEDDAKYLESTKKNLEDVKLERTNNKRVASKLALKEQLTALILNELVSDRELMKKFYSRILIGDLNAIDYTDKAFAIQVVTAFFLILPKNKKE